VAVRVDVRSEINEEVSSRTISRVNVHRLKASRQATINKARERIDRIKLIALIRN
jgi:hypothetical protein